VTINNQSTWDPPAKFSFAMSVLLFLRDVTLITLYFVKKFIDNSAEPLIRPQAEGKYMSRVEMDASINISAYLLDQRDEGLDEEGNNPLHQAARSADGEMESIIG
jgi:hypothetical protein